MKKFLLNSAVLILTIITNQSYAAVISGAEADKKFHGAEEICTSPNSAIPSYLRFQKHAQIEFNLFEKWARSEYKLNANAGFKLISKHDDNLAYTHYRYQQTFNGLPVEGTMYIVHVKNGKIVSMNGLIFDHLDSSPSPVLNETSALNRALEYMNAESYRWQSELYENMIRQQTGDPSATWFPAGELVYAPANFEFKAAAYKLCYRFDVYAAQPVKREYVFVDAATGEIVCTKNRIHSTDVPAEAYTKYSGLRTITTDSVSLGNYRLRETGRGLGIETYNIHQSTNYAGATDFTDTDNVWNNVNVDQDEVATDAHWGAEMTYDYFLLKHGRNSIDGSGQKLLSYVHFDVGLINANWDGTAMNYGDGDLSQGYTPLTCLDVTGHEITHGLTENTANLVYQYESGALNESFSDVFGNTIRQYGKQNPTINWFIGDEMGGTPFRNMADPNQYGDPDTYLGTNWKTGPGDNGGVHSNSGVQNFWYYLLVEGGSGTNDNGDAYTITGLGLDDAAAVAFRSLTVYLVQNSEYADARYYSIQAAIDIFGPCTPEVITVTNAWYAVGVGGAFVPGISSNFTAGATTFCQAPSTVDFINTSINAGSYTWHFGDGDTSTSMNPSHTYANMGNYDVKLVADGGTCGIDSVTKPAYISIDSINPCIIIVPGSGLGPTQTSCTGNMYDSGGPSGNYADNTSSTTTIAPTGASYITLNFSLFDFENNFDYLYIYDGPTTGSPLIGQFTGIALPNGGVIVSTSGAVTIKQESDQGVTNAGFALSWQCTYPTSAPAVDFTADVTTSCSGTINFTDLSTSGPLSWSWDFGDGNTSQLQSPSHTYLVNGTYHVKLVASNAIGTDSLIKSSYITINKPAAPASAGTTICSGSSAQLSATGVDSLTWFDVASGGTALATGSTFNTPVLTSNTTFYVESDVYPAAQHNDPPDNTFGTGSIFTNTNYHDLVFDVYAPVRLVSVLVYAQGAGNRIIELRDNNGINISTAIINIPDGSSRITLNFDLVPGNDYELGIEGNVSLFRNNAGAVFPYTLAGLVSITGTNAGNAGYYYFFYDWELQTPPCTSIRTPVNVTVTPGPVASFSQSANNGTVTFTDASTGATSWTWTFGDGGTSNQQNPVYTYATSGNYTVMLVVSDGTCTDTSYQNISVVAGIPAQANKPYIFVSPNPFSDELVIDLNDLNAGNKYELNISNAIGQTVFERSFTSGLKKTRMVYDLNFLAPGIYTIQVRSNDISFVQKIVRQ